MCETDKKINGNTQLIANRLGILWQRVTTQFRIVL